MDDLSRRDIIKGSAVVAASTLLSSGSVSAQTNQVSTQSDAPVQPVSFLFGTVDDSPNNISELQPGNGFFEGNDWQKTYYAYIYRQPNNSEWIITQEDSEWTLLQEGRSLRGELDLDTATTVTGSGDSPTQITGTTTLVNNTLCDSPSNGIIEYTGINSVEQTIQTTVSVSGANTEFSIWFAHNGTILNRTEMRGFMPNSNTPVSAGITALVSLDPGDTLSVYIENTGGSADLDVETMAVTV